MEVKYKSTYDLVNKTIDYARDAQREIESITLDTSEWFAFHKDSNNGSFVSFIADPEIIYRGTTIKRKQR